MLIWVVEKDDGEPTPDALGREIWRGGYQGDSLDGADQLPASLLAQGDSGIDVGFWYPFSAFEQAIARLQLPEDSRTSLGITTLPAGAEPVSVVQISSIRAIRLLCISVLDIIQKLGRQEHAWIRIE